MAMVKGGSLLFKSSAKSPSSSLHKFYSSRKDNFLVDEVVSKFHKFKAKFVSDSLLLMKNTVLQIDFIAANRIKRLNSLSSFYGQLYGSERLKALVAALTRNLRNRSKHFLLGATLFQASFDWEEARARESDLVKYSQDIETCKVLTQKTLMCQTCQKRLRIEKEVEGVHYCQCKDSPKSVYGVKTDDVDGWTPFLERKDILVWRKEHPTMHGMYFYKMYGRFDDVTAEEFIKVQTDTSDFRLDWDISTAKCAVVDKNESTDQEVYYWETLWPRFFSNRYYCCSRQLVRNVGGSTVLLSKSAQHPKCKSNQSSRVVTVEDYESILTVKPATTSDKMGMEFSLTGFENPGVKLPESIITWVAIRGMPEFMMNLRNACTKYRDEQHTTSTTADKEEPHPPVAQQKTNVRQDTTEESYNINTSRIYA